MTDIYAEFGINNAVMTSENITEHEENMLALPVSVRDGDDSFEVVKEEETVSTELPTDGNEETQEEDQEGSDKAGEEAGADEGTDGDFEPLGDPSEELVKASAQIDEYAAGLDQMRAQAIQAGLEESVADRIEAEYDEKGDLSEESYKALEAVGYSRGFVRSFLNGQEAIAQAYISQIESYAGGKAQFQAILSHLTTNAPDAHAALEAAIERQDLASIKTLINLGMASRTKKFGKTPERNVNKRAPASGPSTPSTPKVQGYGSRGEMVKAMSDPRYANDPVYRSEVEKRVIATNF